ncbi:uncharacterized protein LOC133297639 [Gastrolobium bilobum]|uniref:uncharacterized protein LOC133297639 n=1 Tax=Gastrolobium bilobum TaxID=150636 RepID=UPI002AAFD4F6|nr:uncharacterized protein LOC133297639 [Gastrolobium bilobum]
MVVQRRKRVQQQYQRKETTGGRKFGEDISNMKNPKEADAVVRIAKNDSVMTKVPKENEGKKRSVISTSSGMNFTVVAVSQHRKNTGYKSPVPVVRKQAAKKSKSKGKGVDQPFSSGAASSGSLVEQKSNSVEGHMSDGNYKGERWGDLMMALETSMEEGNPEQTGEHTSEGLLSMGNDVDDPVPPDISLLHDSKKSNDQAGMEVGLTLDAFLINPMSVECNTVCNTEDAVDREYVSVSQDLSSKGAAKKQFKSTFSRFCRKYNVGVAVILEPRVSGSKASRIIRSLGFSNHLTVDAHGFSGGIWVVWNIKDVVVTLISQHEQFVHCWVEFPGLKGFFWTAIYASPHVTSRQVLWEELKHIGRSMDESWLLTGDFNEIALASEKRGRGPVDINKCNLFANVLNSCGVMDLGGGGNRFTWKGPKFLNLDRVYKRLDRAVGNEGWRAIFEEDDVLVLPRLFSDHNPILVRLGKEYSCWRERPFRYLAAWQYDDRFIPFLKASWKPDVGLVDNLVSLVPMLKDWNKNVFGFIQFRKNRIIARMEGIQRQLSSCNSNKLEKLEAELKKELNFILDQEEQLWKKNKILKLQDDRGHWVAEEEELIKLARDFFLNLFKDNSVEPLWFNTKNSWPNIRDDQVVNLGLDLSFEEVKRAFFQMSPLKAPGADGFLAMFYQKNWEMLKAQIFNCMQHYLKNPSQIGEINHTLIVLIPKIDRPCLMKQFWPIALCNTIYKGFSKILANRVKPILEELISPNQASFNERKKKRFFSVKIDLEKAYDKLSWKFIRSVLEELQLPGTLVEAIMGCVSSPSLEVLWNGARTDKFQSQRGIRQGNPLSPYIFVLCMEKLSHLILDEVERKYWVPLREGRSGPPISHIMFADDIILFGEATLSQLNCITTCLDRFSKMSGQCVSFEKSCIYFSKNVKQKTMQNISDVSGFKMVKNFGRYLGSMMRHGRVRKDHYAEVISRVQSRLQGWKSKCLSLVGRITLAKSVISAIPCFHMQNNVLPVHVCNDIEKMQRNFIWRDEESKRKAHYVAWEQMCQPKECGGLGIINLRLQNEAFMHKLAWLIVNDHNSLWVQVLLGKYGRKVDPNRSLIAKKSDSILWKNICLARSKISQQLEWVIRNGKSVFFWTDKWGGWHKTMLELASIKPPMTDLYYKVSDVVDPISGEWNWSYLDEHLSSSICRELRKIPPPNPSNSEERLFWKRIKSGKFVVRNAYCCLLNSNQERDKIWTSVWKWRGPYRIAVFLWLACLDKLPVRSITCHWSGGEVVCPICLRGNESLMHALRDCINARSIWEAWFEGKTPATFLRNATIHEELFSRPQDPLHRILCFLQDMKRSSSCEPSTVVNNLAVILGDSVQVNVHEGVKIFVDGAVNMSTSIELVGILHGLKTAVQLNLADIWMGCDSIEAISCLEADSEAYIFSELIDSIRKLVFSFDHFHLEYVPREDNSVADFLAKMGLEYKGEELRLFPSPLGRVEFT